MIKCPICAAEFEENDTEKQLIEARLAQGWGAVAMDCLACGLSFTYDVDPEAEPPRLYCPSPGCTSRLTLCSGEHAAVRGWHCGDGHTWLGDDLLNIAVRESVSRFPHREMVYQGYRGRWFPVPLDFEPRDFRELAESEREEDEPREILACYLDLNNATNPSRELTEQLRGEVRRLSCMTPSDLNFVHEQTTTHGGVPTTRFGIQLSMTSSQPELRKLHAVELVLESARQMTTEGQHSFTASYNGHYVRNISEGHIDKNIEFGLLRPWREGLAKDSKGGMT